MNTSIAILRGINVSGQKKIKMADLRSLFEETGFQNVQTYIQSGNVIFDHEETKQLKLISIIEKSIYGKYGFEVEVFIKTPSDLKEVLQQNPYPVNPDDKLNKVYFTFLESTPSAKDINQITKINYGLEEFEIKNNVVCLYLPEGYGRTKLNNNFFENKLNVKATTRNWKTINKLVQIVNERQGL